ncbi:MAG: hypothetical protein ABEK17_01145 [Candidatus Aenigmatarchaeota archaeon]
MFLERCNENTLLSWLIHPTDDEEAVESWKEFLELSKGENIKIFLNEGIKDIPLELEEKAGEFEPGKIYRGGWKGHKLTPEMEKDLKDFKHLVMGYKLNYCVKGHVDYLLGRNVSPEDILGSRRYSLKGNHVTDPTENNYSNMGIELVEGNLQDILNNLIEYKE